MIHWKADLIPINLETKIVKKFAWFPVLIGNYYYWLGFYYQKYRYEDGGYYEEIPKDRNSPQCWGDYRHGAQWVEKETALRSEDLPVYEIDNFYKK